MVTAVVPSPSAVGDRASHVKAQAQAALVLNTVKMAQAPATRRKAMAPVRTRIGSAQVTRTSAANVLRRAVRGAVTLAVKTAIAVVLVADIGMYVGAAGAGATDLITRTSTGSYLQCRGRHANVLMLSRPAGGRPHL